MEFLCGTAAVLILETVALLVATKYLKRRICNEQP